MSPPATQPRWLDVPMVDGVAVGPLSLELGPDRQRWDVILSLPFPGEGSVVLIRAGADQIDALTRAWLQQFLPIMRELDMVQEAM